MTDILDRPETLVRDARHAQGPLFAQTLRGVEPASSAFDDGRASAPDERGDAWRRILRCDLL